MRREQRDPEGYTQSTIKPVSEGGTGTSVLDNFITALDVVINDPTDLNGPVIINPDGTIPTDVIPSSIPPIPSVFGPKSLFVSQSGTFTITNYDSDATYSLSAVAGSVSRNNDIITYTAPSTAGINGFRLDGRLISVDVTATGISTPSIVSPVNNTNNLGSSVTFTGTAFAMISQSDTHAMSDWELATDSGFLNVIKSEYSSVVDKSSWSVSGLTPNTTYYVRVRYKGNSFGYSGWSTPIKVSTKSSFTPSSEQAKLQASDRVANDYFGGSVAISSDGNTAIIGANGKDSNRGAVYIFIRSGTSWSVQAKLQAQASDRVANDYFGRSVAISSDGNTAIIGANGKDSGRGAVYIFIRSGTSWSEQAKLQAGDRVAYDYFGRSVAISSDGNTAIIGADGKDSGRGAVYIFIRSGTSWSVQAKLQAQASDRVAYDYFGYSVAISSDGNTAIIGANGKDSSIGAAYIFIRSGTSWSEQAKLQAQAGDRVANDQFGRTVAISSDGNTAIIGAYLKDSAEGTNTGAAYIFIRSGTSWSEQAKLQASDRVANDYFGANVAISSDGNTAIIGADGKDSNRGAVYIFIRSGTSWSVQAKLQAQAGDRVANDYFGYRVAISSDGNTAIIGAYNKDAGMGVAYIYS